MQFSTRRIVETLSAAAALLRGRLGSAKKFQRALGRIAGRGTVNAAAQLIRHRAELLEQTAVLRGIPEEQLLRNVAESLRLPFVLRVPALSVDLQILESRLETFSTLGMLPLFSSGIMTGIAVTDPFLALQSLRGDGLGIGHATLAGSSIYLAPWKEIKRALADSRAAFQQSPRAGAETGRDSRLADTARQVVALIFSEAQTFGSESARIVFETGRIEYSFKTRELKTARGEISARIRPELLQLLSACAGSNMPLVLPEHCAVRVRGTDSAFEISKAATDRKIVPVPLDQLTSEVQPLQPDAPRVLLVEDDPVFAGVLEKYMRRHGLLSRRAESGIHALSLIKSGEFLPALVVCDLQLPNMNGIEFIDALRALETARSTPIIVLTLQDDLETELLMIGKGVDAYLAKSEDPRVLMAHVKRLVGAATQRRAA